MKIDCNNIQAEFQSENCQVDLIANHLAECPSCNKIYKADLKLEQSLKGIADNYRSVDLSSEIMEKLLIKQSRLAKLKLAKTWVNAATVCGIIAGLILALPSLIELSTDFYTWLLASVENIEFLELTNLVETIASINNSNLAEESVYFSILFFGAVVSYLWVELKAVFQ